MPQALLQTVQSHDGAIRSVVEKGEALLASVHYPSIRDNMNRLHNDYTELCSTAMVRSGQTLAHMTYHKVGHVRWNNVREL